MKIAILGWGSLIWDQDTEKGKEFDRWRESKWESVKDLKLPIEFSRVSKSRKDALTLVIDGDNGTECYFRYAFSKRKHFEDAVCDLKDREGTSWRDIGFWSINGSCSAHKLVDHIGSGVNIGALKLLCGRPSKAIFKNAQESILQLRMLSSI